VVEVVNPYFCDEALKESAVKWFALYDISIDNKYYS